MNLANSGRRMSGLHAKAAVQLILIKGFANDPKRTFAVSRILGTLYDTFVG